MGEGKRVTATPGAPASTGAKARASAASEAMRKRFGQGALATPANFVTLARILVAVPTLFLIHDRGATWLTFTLWVLITASDSLDGWMARRDGATRSGAFLDPIADKLIVLGGLAVLADIGEFPWWPVIVIAIREFGISLYRSIAGRRGIVIPAQRLGKYKTFTQYFAVGSFLLPSTSHLHDGQMVCLAIAVIFTVVSGLAILRHGYIDWQRSDN